ncbi:MAG TPA: methyltransferase domain-containing protein [Chloroflexota bacterium]|nr:methyltransferase domain-containing protein [Chloroflexota bacterium]
MSDERVMTWERTAPHLICPKCGERLAAQSGALICPRRHTFDIARDGYVNLLLNVGSGRGMMGDSRAMLQARRRFLDRGHYQPLAQSVVEQVADTLNRPSTQVIAPSREVQRLVDVGCGEGYYLGQLAEHLGTDESTFFFGLDVAKDAARLAAKRYRRAHFVVADAWRHLPFPDDSVDVLLNLFAPRNASEFARVAAPDGLLLVVVPTERHLIEVRVHLQGTVPFLRIEEEKEERMIRQLAATFDLQGDRHLEYGIDLTPADVVDLVEMTPSARHLSGDDRARLQHVSGLRATVSVSILSFRRNATRR